jgi:hypothetical protein
MCGHQDQAINPISYGEIDYGLLTSIREEVEPGITISLHRDGEPTAYSQLRKALELFRGFTVSLVTHGLNLARRSEEIINNCTTVTVSVFRGDRDADEQRNAIKGFLASKGARPPQVQVKIVGDMEQDGIDEYEALGVRILRRLIHVPISNSKYAHRVPTIPEVGVCLDALHRPSVDSAGRVFLCNRLDPARHTQIGNLYENTLDEIWNGPTRMKMLDAHKVGRRDLANDLCKTCSFWGVASE